LKHLELKKADIAGINTFSYLLANSKYGAEARLRIVRAGNETTYKGQFITRTDSGIDDIEICMDGRNCIC
jgi:phosphonate transport system substrate-binding protein